MIIFLTILQLLLATFVGSWCISYAIKCFKRESYFGFGLHAMLAAWEITLLVRTVLTMY